jgi:hypothetical protein
VTEVGCVAGMPVSLVWASIEIKRAVGAKTPPLLQDKRAGRAVCLYRLFPF